MTHPVPTLPDVWWEDLQVGSHWQTRSRTITEPDLVAWLNLTWLTEELFTNLADRSGSAIAGRFVPGALVFSFAEALTLGAVRIHGSGRQVAMRTCMAGSIPRRRTARRQPPARGPPAW